MKTLFWIFSIVLFTMSFGMIVLYGASGHGFNLNDGETLKSIGIIFLYVVTGITLIWFRSSNQHKLRKILITLLSLVFASFIYLFFEIFHVKIGDYAAMFPIFLLFLSTLLCARILYLLIRSHEI